MGLDFYHHICNTCFSTPGKRDGKNVKFQSCAGCKLVSYCSRSHQKTDWREHKDFCLEVQKLLQTRKSTTLFSSLEIPTHQSLYNYQSAIIEMLGKQLKRDLTFCERSMIYFPDICGMCLRPNGNAIVSCENCNLQFYCCPDDLLKHSKTHQKECEPLKLCFELFQFLSTNLDHLPSKVCPKELKSSSDFPPTLDEYLNTFMKIDHISIFDKVIFSDILSYLLTVVYVIQNCDKLKIKTRLSIHIIGSTFVESYILTILDIFFLWLESVECLNLVFVGPDCPPPDEDYINSIYEKHSDKNLTVTFHPEVLYHELSLGQGVTNPDVIVAFNCGFHEFKGQNCDTWQKTLEFILTLEDVVLITTSYTLKEAEEDSQPFIGKEDTVNAWKVCEQNPFKSLNPHRNPERSESAIFFFNQYVSAFNIK